MSKTAISWKITEYPTGEPVQCGSAEDFQGAEQGVQGWLNLYALGEDGPFTIAPGYASITFDAQGAARRLYRAAATGARLCVHYMRS